MTHSLSSLSATARADLVEIIRAIVLLAPSVRAPLPGERPTHAPRWLAGVVRDLGELAEEVGLTDFITGETWSGERFLMEAQRAGIVACSRCDLVQCYDRDAVRESATTLPFFLGSGGAPVVHWVRIVPSSAR